MALSSESRIPEAAGPMAVISSRTKTFIGDMESKDYTL